MADEKYLQKGSEYARRDFIGAEKDVNLYKGIVFIVVVGVKTNTPYMIKASPEVSIHGYWLADEMDGCIPCQNIYYIEELKNIRNNRLGNKSSSSPHLASVFVEKILLLPTVPSWTAPRLHEKDAYEKHPNLLTISFISAIINKLSNVLWPSFTRQRLPDSNPSSQIEAISLDS